MLVFYYNFYECAQYAPIHPDQSYSIFGKESISRPLGGAQIRFRRHAHAIKS